MKYLKSSLIVCRRKREKIIYDWSKDLCRTQVINSFLPFYFNQNNKTPNQIEFNIFVENYEKD